jgi:hypothetical protein
MISRLLRHRAPDLARISAGLALLPLLAAATPEQAAWAQETKTQDTTATSRDGRQETVKQIAERLSQSTGVRVVADTALSRSLLTAPEDAVTTATLEAYLTRLNRRLPPGSVWMKVYLPPTTGSRRFAPDAVAHLARAQMDLLGRPAPNTVQIQGNVLTLAEAEPIIRTLRLEPVYVLARRQGPLFPAGPEGEKSTTVMEALTKQLGLGNVNDIPVGTYKVTFPGADGSPSWAIVEVENVAGGRRISVRSDSPTEQKKRST